MDQRIGRDAGKPRARVVIVDDLRLVGEIAARHHHRSVDVAKQKKMQRRGRQHEAERGKARRDRVGEPLGTGRVEQHDRRLGAREKRLLRRTHAAIAADDVEVARHQRERLGVAPLRCAQAFDRFGIGRVAGEVVAAEPLDGDDLALLDQAAGGIEIVEHRVSVDADRRAVEPDERRVRPAGRAGDRLGVESPVARIAIFARHASQSGNAAIVVTARS